MGHGSTLGSYQLNGSLSTDDDAHYKCGHPRRPNDRVGDHVAAGIDSDSNSVDFPAHNGDFGTSKDFDNRYPGSSNHCETERGRTGH